MANAPLNPSADFRDDGGTPAFRAKQRTKHLMPLWTVIRFLWLFPIVGTAGLFISFMAWMAAMVFLGPAWVADNWGWIIAFSFAVAWGQLVKKSGGLGAGPLWFSGMMNSPSGGAWGAIATYFRSLFLLAYAGYALFFWVILGIALWIWQSGSWQHAMATAGAG